MKGRFLVLFIIVFVAPSARSGDHAGFSGALLWQASPLNTPFDNLDDKSVDVQYRWGVGSAARVVLLSRSFRHTRVEEAAAIQDNHFRKKYYYHIGLEYEKYVRGGRKTFFYVGGGPALHIAEKSSEGTKANQLDGYHYGAALALRFGVEYHLLLNMYLRLEYLTVTQFGIAINDYYFNDRGGLVPYSGRVASYESFPLLGVGFCF